MSLAGKWAHLGPRPPESSSFPRGSQGPLPFKAFEALLVSWASWIQVGTSTLPTQLPHHKENDLSSKVTLLLGLSAYPEGFLRVWRALF